MMMTELHARISGFGRLRRVHMMLFDPLMSPAYFAHCDVSIANDRESERHMVRLPMSKHDPCLAQDLLF